VRTAAGTLVALATIVSLIAGASSRDHVVVPDVVGVDVHSAYDQLRGAGFPIRIEEPIAIGAANVSEQSVAPGNKAPLDGVVVLKLDESGFRGPGLLPWNTSTVLVPILVGKSLPEAVGTLASLGLSSSIGLLPALPAGTEPTLLHNYEVSAQKPKPGRPFRQTRLQETAEGDVLSETTTVLLVPKLRQRRSPG
jgi:beta-lactam-binding protein with PASTA domain